MINEILIWFGLISIVISLIKAIQEIIYPACYFCRGAMRKYHKIAVTGSYSVYVCGRCNERAHTMVQIYRRGI